MNPNIEHDGTEPAFPVHHPLVSGHLTGISKRDWLAAQFLQAIIIGSATHNERKYDLRSFSLARDMGGGASARISREVDGKIEDMDIYTLWVREAYDLADTMLREGGL